VNEIEKLGAAILLILVIAVTTISLTAGDVLEMAGCLTEFPDLPGINFTKVYCETWPDQCAEIVAMDLDNCSPTF